MYFVWKYIYAHEQKNKKGNCDFLSHNSNFFPYYSEFISQFIFFLQIQICDISTQNG